MKKKLPEGWAESELKNIISFVIGGDWGKDPVKTDDKDYIEVSCIRGSEIKDWNKEKGSTASLRKIKKSSLEKRELIEGDILIEISGGGPDQPVGRILFIDEEALSVNDLPKICTNFLRLVRIENILNQKFVSQFLEYFYLSGQVIEYQGGSNNLRNLKFKAYQTIKIPLPPRAEQDRIVAKLDTLFGQLEQINKSLDHISTLLKNFRQQVLTEAVTGKLTEEWRKGKELEEWHLNTIGNLFKVQTGSTPKRGTPEYYENATIPWLKSGQVKNELIYSAEEFITPKAIKDTNAKVYPIDTLLVAMYGEGKTRGQVGWMKLEAASNQAIAALVNENMKDDLRSYVYHFCLSQYNEIRAQAEGGNQPNLNLTKIKNWQINIPSETERIEIVNRVEKLFAKADAIEAHYEALKTKIEHLPQAILHKAFKGKLVPQLDSDGDARELFREIEQLKKDTKSKK